MESVTVLSVEGDINWIQMCQLRERVEQAIHSSKLRIVLDLRKVEHLHYSECGELLSLFREVKEAGGDLRVAGMNRYVFQIFRFAGLEGMIPSFISVSEAIESFETPYWKTGALQTRYPYHG